MLHLNNTTPFAAERAVLSGISGQQVWVVGLKATFTIERDQNVTLAKVQEPVVLAPEYAKEPERSSLLRDAELVCEHVGTDVILNATAYAPNGQPVERTGVLANVGHLSKSLAVVGHRIWERHLGRVRLSPPKPFIKMPITYENAFGGVALTSQNFDPRNPAGRGFCDSAKELVGRYAPNIEAIRVPIESPKQKPEPVGLGAICSTWLPRRSFAGTYDAAWQTHRMPFWPEDLDHRFFSCASPGLIATPHLRGGEHVTLVNLTPEGRLQFQLPRLHFGLRTYLRGAMIRTPFRLERVIIEPDKRKLVMVWRASLECGGSARFVTKSVVEQKKVLHA